MSKRLFLLDGMALVYRAHFAFASRPIVTSKGVNTSAIYGFTNTLLDIIKTQQPTHLAVAFDTAAPTHRHVEFPEYKAQREQMPEDLSDALPRVRRLIEAFHIPLLISEGFEADDIIGTLVRRAETQGFESFMVTPDKDFGQLVSEHTFICKLPRMGEGIEIMGVPEVLAKWGIERPAQVIDVLALWGDASDNIPGVPGIGEKTAAKLIAQYGSVENLLQHTGELKGKLRENLEANREMALLSKRLATILCDAPCAFQPDDLLIRERDDEQLRRLFMEFEFFSLGRRLFGDNFKPGGLTGAEKSTTASPAVEKPAAAPATEPADTQPEQSVETGAEAAAADAPTVYKTIAETPHTYHLVTTPADRAALLAKLRASDAFAFRVEATLPDVKQAQLIGLAFSLADHEGWYVALPGTADAALAVLEEFRGLFEDERIEKTGHDLKRDLAILQWHALTVRGKFFDTLIARCLIEPETRNSLEYLAGAYLGYAPMRSESLEAEAAGGQIGMGGAAPELVADRAVERVDIIWQLRARLRPLLAEKGQERVFYELESPLIPVLVDMEHEGVRIDATVLAEFSVQLARDMAQQEARINELAGAPFNLNSPKQLGEVLFDRLKINPNAKKTKTGQYATNEQTLLELAPEHEIVRCLLEYRAASKLKSTYTDALPAAIWSRTGRVHTTYFQMATATGRLNSQDPNLQNIPIRTEKGREIRKAFVPRNPDYLLLSADYSQIELRIIAELGRETGMREAFRQNLDIHAATAAKVFGVSLEMVTLEMRRRAKMVNFGIAYGISAFGLAQRLGIPRKEAAAIIEQYFIQYPGIARYMQETIESARQKGYVETVTGRRRYLRDIRSGNATVRGSAERNAINAPIQGTAADMIKIAMVNIHRELRARNLKTRMLLQVHDELVFDVRRDEEAAVRPIILEKMRTAIPMETPIVVEIGAGETWLEAH